MASTTAEGDPVLFLCAMLSSTSTAGVPRAYIRAAMFIGVVEEGVTLDIVPLCHAVHIRRNPYF